MTDRIVIKTWWLFTLAMVAVTAIGCVMSAYFGLFDLIEARWGGAGSLGMACFVLGSGSFMLCKYRGDIVGD